MQKPIYTQDPNAHIIYNWWQRYFPLWYAQEIEM
jgi:hypothetical protein